MSGGTGDAAAFGCLGAGLLGGGSSGALPIGVTAPSRRNPEDVALPVSVATEPLIVGLACPITVGFKETAALFGFGASAVAARTEASA